MKYDLHIPQRIIVEDGYDLDIVEAALLNFCTDFSSKTFCRFMFEDGERWYWFSHKLLCDGLPILRLKKDSMYRRMKGLCEKGFLQPHPENRALNTSWYAFTAKMNRLTVGLKSEPSEQNPVTLGAKSVGGTDENPMYYNNNIIQEERVVVGSALGLPSTNGNGVNVKESDIFDPVNKASSPSRKKNPSTVIHPPALDEVITYMVERGGDAREAQRMYDYYTANGWRVGKNQMKDWRAACRYWLNGKDRGYNTRQSKEISTKTTAPIQTTGAVR